MNESQAAVDMADNVQKTNKEQQEVIEITANGVSYTDKDGGEHFVKADTAILAIGDKPDTSLYDSLKNELPEIYNIGDSAGGGIIPCAVYDGYTLGCRI